MKMPKSICVIGAGPSGLTAMKACSEGNLEVTCYEQSNRIGGVWNYSDEDINDIPSFPRSTVSNSSKEICAFSDFPPPQKCANYMHHSQMLAYYNEYVELFGLGKCIQFNKKVIKCENMEDKAETGRWKVTIKDARSDETFTKNFDGVMVCTGHMTKPLIPIIKGQEKFKGRIIHSHSYKTPIPFDDQIVVVSGFGDSGDSGGDIAVELSFICKQVYHSYRRGSWILGRMGSFGKPFDCQFLKRSHAFIRKYLPFNLTSWFLESMLNFRFDHELYKLKPYHRITEQTTIINDCYASRVLSGRILPKSSIKEFTEDGVIFTEDGEKPLEVKCDSVILATGYELDFSFLDKSIICSVDNEVFLYKHVFSPRLENPESLAIIGLVEPFGPVVPISEMQSRWFVALNTGNCCLPTTTTMVQDIRNKSVAIKEQFGDRSRYPIQADYVQLMDEVADLIGVKPDLKFLFLNDPILWSRLIFGPFLPYQFRLTGSHIWSGARKAIIDVDKRICEPFNTREVDKGAKEESIQLLIRHAISFFMLILLILMSFSSIIIAYYY